MQSWILAETVTNLTQFVKLKQWKLGVTKCPLFEVGYTVMSLLNLHRMWIAKWKSVQIISIQRRRKASRNCWFNNSRIFKSDCTYRSEWEEKSQKRRHGSYRAEDTAACHFQTELANLHITSMAVPFFHSHAVLLKTENGQGALPKPRAIYSIRC